MTNFDWHTEEDERPGLRPQPGPDDGGKSPRRPWLFVLLALLVIAAAYGLYRTYSGVQDHLTETTERIENEVQASDNVIRAAAQRGDRELFVRFLSGADPAWSGAQEEMVERETWLDRPAFNLTWNPSITDSATISVSNDLTAATLTTSQRYTYSPPGGEETTVVLEQTGVFRLGPDRWLYAPPTSEFWGDTRQLRLTTLDVTYPGRDEEVVQRLVHDLDDLLKRMCSEQPGVACPPGMQLALEFGNEAALLLARDGADLPLWAETPLVLATPSLVGLPVDEQGYEALYQGYARQVAAAAMVTAANWQCCEQGLFMQALLDGQLQALGLPPFTTKTPNYRALVGHANFDLNLFGALWSEPPVGDTAITQNPSLESAKAIVEFLLERQPELSMAALQRSLTLADSYEAWMGRFAGPPGSARTALNWRAFLYDRQERSRPVPETPEQDLLLVCTRAGSGNMLFHREAGRQPDTAEPPGTAISSMGPGAILEPHSTQGVVVADGLAEQSGEHLRLSVWQDGSLQHFWDSEEEGQGTKHYSYVGSSADGRYLVVASNDPDRRYNAFLVGETARCLDGDCEWQRSIHRPLWSPDSRHVIQSSGGTGNMLYLTEARAVLQPFWYMDFGTAPFWLDNQTFGYAQQSPDGQLRAVVLASVGYEERQTLISASELDALLPPSAILSSAIEPLVHPVDPNLFFLAVQGIRSDNPIPTFVFVGSRNPRQIQLLFTAGDVRPGSFTVSPSGRWLSMSTAEGLLFHDLLRNETEVLPYETDANRVVWSPSGNWLFTSSGSLLLAPADDYRRILLGEGVACSDGAWLEQ